jgi:glutathione S-transferase
MKLYDGQRSPNARKVRLLAAELGLPLELAPLDFTKGELRSPEFLRKNPNGKIPTLDDDGFVLWESAAVLRYLAGKRPERGLIPSDPQGQAKLDQWMFWWAAHPEAALLSLVLERLVKPFLKQETDAGVVRAAEADLTRFLPLLDQQLADKEYLLGALTILDFGVAPWLETAPRLGVDVARYVRITPWLARMQARPYWKDA